MNFEIDRKNRTPLYLQIVECVKANVGSGMVPDGGKLPTERELSETLGVSRNTVSQAYQVLEFEGFAKSSIGRGTFITSNSHHHEQSRSHMLLRHVRHSVDEALALGFSLSELESAIHEYIKNREKILATVRMVFIECNFEQANYFSHHLDLDPRVEIVPLILDDLREGKASALKELEKADVVVTSFYHLSEIEKLAEFSKKNIEAVSMEPDVATLIRIARLPSSGTLGIVTTSEQFLREIKRSLRENNLRFDVTLEASKSSSQALESILKNAEAIIVSPGRKREIQKKAKEGVEMIEFVFSPDRTSINNLKITIVELEKAQNKQKEKSTNPINPTKNNR